MLQFKPLGDQGIQIQFSDQPSIEIIQAIHAYKRKLEAMTELPLLECVPAYTTLSIYYDPLRIDYHTLVSILHTIHIEELQAHAREPRIVEVPACYHPSLAPDLVDLANYHRLSVEEVISLHSTPAYFIYMIGFLPGFPYLGGLSKKLATPRLRTPRARVAAGSIGIAGEQTGIYPVESPGGWRIIARTPLKIYDPSSEQPFLFQAGDYLKFLPISLEEFQQLSYNSLN